jgi:hypothetical protein
VLCFDMDVDRGCGNWKLGVFAVDHSLILPFRFEAIVFMFNGCFYNKGTVVLVIQKTHVMFRVGR